MAQVRGQGAVELFIGTTRRCARTGRNPEHLHDEQCRYGKRDNGPRGGRTSHAYQLRKRQTIYVSVGLRKQA